MGFLDPEPRDRSVGKWSAEPDRRVGGTVFSGMKGQGREVLGRVGVCRVI